MYDQPGVRVPVVFPGQGEGNEDPIAHGAAAVIDNKVGFLAKTEQIDRFTRPDSSEATDIQPGEGCEIFIGGVHRLALTGALAGAVAGDKLYIDADNNVLVAPGEAEGASNEVQKVTVKAKKGNFTLEFDGEKTGNIKFNATAKEVQEALELIDSIDPGDVVAAGGPGDEGGTTPYTCTFGGQYADEDVPALIAAKGTLEEPGEVTVTTTKAGAAGAGVFPLGVIDKVDTAPTPDVAYVNTNALASFITV
jgi:hypothetical protein